MSYLLIADEAPLSLHEVRQITYTRFTTPSDRRYSTCRLQPRYLQNALDIQLYAATPVVALLARSFLSLYLCLSICPSVCLSVCLSLSSSLATSKCSPSNPHSELKTYSNVDVYIQYGTGTYNMVHTIWYRYFATRRACAHVRRWYRYSAFTHLRRRNDSGECSRTNSGKCRRCCFRSVRTSPNDTFVRAQV
eukprot:3677840-Pleurochrysis_carterae.AAC.1